MEAPAQYGDAPLDIRPETLREFGAGWEPPTAAEIRAVIRLAGLTAGEVAALVGMPDRGMVQRWTTGDAPVPFAAWAILCEVAGLGTIWRVVYEERGASG
ncbi:MAG: helix-turn-helix transcriptional regulator [Pigmentiphaga sp.]|uniref:helix-turn-helix transcriptional regulator n=1 Tax=Pigmentiphaga sp. TaxID=1977564 RepID=UPI0029A4EA7A|nr:helix-turn-helix transcriptional regulator [Pigmentiphaga sp.]MDX3904428.1 helix-turn-helix transcriptional regulator [Pigmentiphaga sp.]